MATPKDMPQRRRPNDALARDIQAFNASVDECGDERDIRPQVEPEMTEREALSHAPEVLANADFHSHNEAPVEKREFRLQPYLTHRPFSGLADLRRELRRKQ